MTAQQTNQRPPADQQSLMVGVDGTQESMHALEWAAWYARDTGCTLHIVSSFMLPGFTGSYTFAHDIPMVDDPYARRYVEDLLDRAHKRVAEIGVPATTEVATGDATTVLAERSAAHRFVVIGARGAGGFVERLLGTVSANLPVRAQCPTVVVPLHARDDGADGRDPGRRGRRIVVGADGSRSSEAAVEAAVAQAQEWGAEVVVARAVTMVGWSHSPWLDTGFRDSVMEAARADTDRLRDRLRTTYPDVVTRTDVVEGHAVDVLVAASRDADLLVVGSRGRGGIRGLVLGSTSQAVLRRSLCPVLVPRR
ncbi:universal stress protein [Isoptericola sp. NPDC019693]|uniref:universal stress protein n=1 Tax=Isoptericola sp. NPDC019693 TaxID=3364009 RepID=UPI0037A03A61